MKKVVLVATMLIIGAVASVDVNAQANCAVDGYVGPNGSSCLYKKDGCFYKVTHHRFLFGIFRWNTEELETCDDFAPF